MSVEIDDEGVRRVSRPEGGACPRHVHPFAIHVASSNRARYFGVTVTDSAGRRYELVNFAPRIDLADVWDNLAYGYVWYQPWAVDVERGIQRAARVYAFNKGRPFGQAGVPPARMPWAEASRVHWEYVRRLEQVPQAYDPALPAWFWHAYMHADSGVLASKAYPGLHYGFHLESLRRYAAWDPGAREEAVALIRRLITFLRQWVTPDDWAWGGYLPSTISQERRGGDREPDGVLQPCKAAFVASAMVQMDPDWVPPDAMDWVRHVARRLATAQADDGSLPYRVDARTGTWLSGPTSSVIFAADLWDRLRERGIESFEPQIDRARSWLEQHVLSTGAWVATYEDVAPDRTDWQSNNLHNFDAVWAALWYLRHAATWPDALSKAQALEQWVEDNFVFVMPEAPVEGRRFTGPVVMEQVLHYYPIDFHAGNLARLEWALYDATGDERYRANAEALLNALTYHITPSGIPLTYAPDPDYGRGLNDIVWFGCAAAAWAALTDGAARTDKAFGRQSVVR